MSNPNTNQGLLSRTASPSPDRGPMMLGILIAADYALVVTEITHAGLGKPIVLNMINDPTSLTRFMKLLYTQQIFFPFPITTIKFSFLVMFWRLFPTKFMKWGTIVLSIFFTMWLIAVVVPTIFQCYPVYKMWNRMMPTGFCNPGIALWIQWIDSVPQLLSDIFLFLLPIVEVKRLHASKGTKAGISAIFALSSLSIIGRIMVLVEGVKTTNRGQEVDITSFLTWTGLSAAEKSSKISDRDIITFGQMGRRDGVNHKYRSNSSQRNLYHDATVLSDNLVDNCSFELLEDDEANNTSFRSEATRNQHIHTFQVSHEAVSRQVTSPIAINVSTDSRWQENRQPVAQLDPNATGVAKGSTQMAPRPS
ncbi:unnamed protein product [Clonostachys chloroleuca]|uniref:Rhodopsin domain-containing protein n=1 Tax=Clonostachys chloroleuca TaxID=1926264 RepID=A0AA35Q6E2_9HYPO|nr:unnamed protein product [Clonostachys chloroleuca]